VEQLHRAALQYYESKPGLSDQAEYLFHRLQVDDPAFLEQNDYDYARLRPFLESALSELPPSAASALGRMFDLRVEPASPDTLNEEEWERNMDREIAKSLEDGVPESQLLELWERIKDKPGSFRGYQYRRAIVAVRLGLALEAPPAIYQLESEGNPLDAVYLLLQLGNYQNDPSATQAAVKQLIGLPDGSGWLDFIPATLLIAKWAGLHNRSGTIAPADLLKALEPLIGIHISFQQKLPKSDNLLLRMPLRYATLGRKLEWEPLARLYTLAENAEQTSSETYAFRQSFNQAFHAAVQDYDRLREERIYQQLVDHLLGLGLEKTNGQLYRAYQVLVSDLSEPGSWPTVVHDLADYLVARHGGKLEAAGKAFGIKLSKVQEDAPLPGGRPRGFTPPEDPEPVQDLQAFKADLRSKIADGRIEQALKALEGMGDEYFQNSIILLSGRFNRMQQDQRMGLTTDSATNIERNRIRQALLSYLEELE